MKHSRKRMAYMAAMEKQGKMPREHEEVDADEMEQRLAYGGHVEEADFNPDDEQEEHFNSSGDPGIDDEDDEEQDMRYMAKGGLVPYGQEKGARPDMRFVGEQRPMLRPEPYREELDEHHDEDMAKISRMSRGGFAKAIKRSRGGFCY
jgi:hypothetical protein